MCGNGRNVIWKYTCCAGPVRSAHPLNVLKHFVHQPTHKAIHDIVLILIHILYNYTQGNYNWDQFFLSSRHFQSTNIFYLSLEVLDLDLVRKREWMPNLVIQSFVGYQMSITKCYKRCIIDVKLKELLSSKKDNIPEMERSGIYEETCSCKYFGQTKRQVLTGYKEHCRHVRLDQTDKSAVAVHALEKLHSLEFIYLSLLKFYF